MTADKSTTSKAAPTVPAAILGVKTHLTLKETKGYLLNLAKSKVQASLAIFFHYSEMKDATIEKGAAVVGLPRSQYGHLKTQGQTILACGPDVTAAQAEGVISVGTYGGSMAELQKALKECQTSAARTKAIKDALQAAKDKKKAGSAQPPTGDQPEQDASGIQTEPEKKATDSSRLESAATVLAAVKGGGKPKPEDVANLSAIVAHAARIVESYGLTPADLQAAAA